MRDQGYWWPGMDQAHALAKSRKKRKAPTATENKIRAAKARERRAEKEKLARAERRHLYESRVAAAKSRTPQVYAVLDSDEFRDWHERARGRPFPLRQLADHDAVVAAVRVYLAAQGVQNHDRQQRAIEAFRDRARAELDWSDDLIEDAIAHGAADLDDDPEEPAGEPLTPEVRALYNQAERESIETGREYRVDLAGMRVVARRRRRR